MQQFVPSDFHQALSQHLAGQYYDGLFIASLDHSPTEQLVGERWHTSALILSAAVEHSALAHALAEIANPRTRKLTKWKSANKHYRQRFCAGLMPKLDLHRVMVIAISAEETSIADSEPHFVKELGGSGHYRRFEVEGRPRVLIGPFVNAQTGEEQTVQLAGNQAPMVFFIAHFLRRIHQQICAALSATHDAPVYVTWNFFADKPPDGPGGAFDRAVTMLLSLSDPRGALRWGYFLDGDTVETDLLADNVAGLLNEMMQAPQRYSVQLDGLVHKSAGLFYWEQWTT